MAVITLLTDFGLKDGFVGIMKGVMIGINPDAVIVDITHGIDGQDVVEAAYQLKAAYRYFPEGTVHLVVVDPGVGSFRRILAVRMGGQVFVAPDNGVLSLVLAEHEKAVVVAVENRSFFREPVSRTFHGRDIFAPVGARLSTGTAIFELGPKIERNDIVLLKTSGPRITDRGSLAGTVISIDRFGNLMTDIEARTLERFAKDRSLRNTRFIIGRKQIDGLSSFYQSVDAGKPLAVIGSWDHLEIAVNRGSARDYFQVEKGDPVEVVMIGEFQAQ